MKQGARLQAVIEIIDRILNEAHVPADAVVNDYLRERRFIGSSDRRFITDFTYDTLRRVIHYQGYCRHLNYGKEPARTIVLCHLHFLNTKKQDIEEWFCEAHHHPDTLSRSELTFMENLNTTKIDQLTEAEQLGVTAWSLQQLQLSYPDTVTQEIAALNEAAPVDLRVNLLKAQRPEILKTLNLGGIEATPTPLSPTGIRLKRRTNLSQHPLWLNGTIEVQDEGSQLVAYLAGAAPGMSVLDYCAGAGGKTLAIAALMANKGRLIATDPVEWRLQRSKDRFKRASVFNAECRALNPETNKWLKRQQDHFDRVLVDVPCSGSGTWRRNPDLRWRMSESAVHEIMTKQQEILEKVKSLVKPGGRLIYATCSLYTCENQQQIERFLEANPTYKPVPVATVWQEAGLGDCPTSETFLQLSPARNHTDGFFVAILERTV